MDEFKQKVELLNRLVAMRKRMGKGPKATTNPPRRGGYGRRDGMIVDRFDGPRRPGRGGGSFPSMPGREPRSVPTRLPRYDRMPGGY